MSYFERATVFKGRSRCIYSGWPRTCPQWPCIHDLSCVQWWQTCHRAQLLIFRHFFGNFSTDLGLPEVTPRSYKGRKSQGLTLKLIHLNTRGRNLSESYSMLILTHSGVGVCRVDFCVLSSCSHPSAHCVFRVINIEFLSQSTCHIKGLG